MSMNTHAHSVKNPHDRSVAPAQPSPLARAGMVSGGQALDKHTQASMSSRFGHDFSQVRIHTDARASASADALGANAFATGNDIVFGEGRYTPGSLETERLLTHELTHVVQQSHYGPGDPTRVSNHDDASEREADALTADLSLGKTADVRAIPGAAIARDAANDEKNQRCVAGPAAGTPASEWAAWNDNPLWNFTTNDAVSGSVAMTQTHLSDLHGEEAGKSIAAENAMQEEFRIRDYGDNHGWSMNESGTAEEIGAQKSLWKAGAALEEDTSSALNVERSVANTASKFSPALKAASTVGRFLAPLGLYSDGKSMIEDWQKGEHADAVADGAGMTSAAIGTVDAAAALGTWTGLASTGGALASTAEFLNPAGAVLGAGAGGYALGKYGLGKANTYAKNNDIFGKGDDGESRDSTEAAGDAGEWVKEHTGNGVFGSILGGATAIGSSWGTAAYSGIHAAGSGIKGAGSWLWDHTFGDSGPSDEEMAANQASADAVMTETADEMMNAEIDSELEHNMHYTQTAHDDPPPPPR